MNSVNQCDMLAAASILHHPEPGERFELDLTTDCAYDEALSAVRIDGNPEARPASYGS